MDGLGLWAALGQHAVCTYYNTTKIHSGSQSLTPENTEKGKLKT